jgi:hypothetical protein
VFYATNSVRIVGLLGHHLKAVEHAARDRARPVKARGRRVRAGLAQSGGAVIVAEAAGANAATAAAVTTSTVLSRIHR